MIGPDVVGAAMASGVVRAPGFENDAAALLESLSQAEIWRMEAAINFRAQIEAAANRKERRRLQALWRRGKL